jgi:hypothetical protein
MDNLFLPKSIDNYYRGQKLALWFFWLVVIIRAAQGVSLIVGGHSIVRDADGIARLVLSLLAVIVFTFYRSAIPLMLALLALDQIAKELLLLFYPLYRIGNPIGPVVNLVLLSLTVMGFVLSIWSRQHSRS